MSGSECASTDAPDCGGPDAPDCGAPAVFASDFGCCPSTSSVSFLLSRLLRYAPNGWFRTARISARVYQRASAGAFSYRRYAEDKDAPSSSLSRSMRNGCEASARA